MRKNDKRSKDDKTNGNYNSNNKSSQSSRGNKKIEENNFQDKAEKREYNKGFRRGKSSSSKAVIKGASGDGNDIHWHYIDEGMFNGATGLTFNQATGLPLITAPGSGSAISHWTSHETPSPGIFMSYFIPSLGQAVDGRSPVNVAATRLFQYLRRDKSGKEIYQPGDIAIHLGAMDSAYMLYEYAVKIYGMAQNVDLVNWYTPRSLVEAHGMNFDSVNSRLADFKFWIDYYATRLAGLFVPEGIRLFDRHAYMVRGLFTDSSTAKAQYYAFVPTHLWKFVEGTAENPAGSLEMLQIVHTPEFDEHSSLITANLLTVEQLMELGEALIAPLLDSETVRNINADLMTAFKGNNCYSVGRISPDYMVRPTFDEQYLMQLENAFYYGYDNTADGKYLQHVEINNSYVYSSFTLSPNVTFPTITEGGKTAWNAIQRVRIPLNFHKSEVSKEDVMYASRFAGFGFDKASSGNPDGKGPHTLKTHGSEIFTNYAILYFKNNPENSPYGERILSGFVGETYEMANLGTTLKIDSSAALSLGSARSTVNTLMLKDTLLSMFDWHPKVFTVVYTLKGAGVGYTGNELTVHAPKFDLDNWAFVEENQLEMLNLVSLMGLLICRDLGYYSQK